MAEYKNPTLEEMIEMNLHEEFRLGPAFYVMRVPGGWLYLFYEEGMVAFVPEPKEE